MKCDCVYQYKCLQCGGAWSEEVKLELLFEVEVHSRGTSKQCNRCETLVTPTVERYQITSGEDNGLSGVYNFLMEKLEYWASKQGELTPGPLDISHIYIETYEELLNHIAALASQES